MLNGSGSSNYNGPASTWVGYLNQIKFIYIPKAQTFFRRMALQASLRQSFQTLEPGQEQL